MGVQEASNGSLERVASPSLWPPFSELRSFLGERLSDAACIAEAATQAKRSMK
jgi:hypothetical protein